MRTVRCEECDEELELGPGDTVDMYGWVEKSDPALYNPETPHFLCGNCQDEKEDE